MILNIITPEGTKSTFPATYSTAKENTFLRGQVSSSVTSVDVQYGGELFTLHQVMFY